MPFYRCALASNLTAESAIARLNAATGPVPSLWQFLTRNLSPRPSASPPFIGKIEGDRFKVRRDVRYRNSFLPIVTGRVASVPSGVRIDVTMSLHPAVAVFMLIWFSAVGLAAVVSAWTLLRGPRDEQLWFLMPWGMLIFGVVLVGGGFFPEAMRARRLLEQLLDATSSRS